MSSSESDESSLIGDAKSSIRLDGVITSAVVEPETATALQENGSSSVIDISEKDTKTETQNGSILIRSFGEDLEDELFPFIDSSFSRSNSKSDFERSKKLSSNLRKIRRQSYSMAPLETLVFTRLDECPDSRNLGATGPRRQNSISKSRNGISKSKNGSLVTSQSAPLNVALNGLANLQQTEGKTEEKISEKNNSSEEEKNTVFTSVYSLCKIAKSQRPMKKSFIPIPNDKVLGIDDKMSLRTNSPKMKSDESWHDSIRDCRDELWKRFTGGFRSRPSRQLVKKATKQMKREHKATVTLAVVLGKI